MPPSTRYYIKVNNEASSVDPCQNIKRLGYNAAIPAFVRRLVPEGPRHFANIISLSMLINKLCLHYYYIFINDLQIFSVRQVNKCPNQ
ncbi:hypothetical protein P9112_011049 [Eukaryota sp. TZLM1-RC]